jgi:TDG/mug DNA glycosylase family protein
MARTLGVTGLQLRNWLRDRKAEGHPLLVGHRKHEPYKFSSSEAQQLLAEYRAGTQTRRASRSPAQPSHAAAVVPASTAPEPLSDEPGHRVTLTWMGHTVTTLEDLLRPGLLAVVVGINPAPPSVAAGHYWQGQTGRTLWRRLTAVGLLPEEYDGFEDDAAFAAGIGFTDVVKRPTKSAGDLRTDELSHGLGDLRRKLEAAGAPLVIFAFKKAATTLLGDFDGNGFVRPLMVGPSEVFVMPGPYEKTAVANATLESLRSWVTRRR